MFRGDQLVQQGRERLEITLVRVLKSNLLIKEVIENIIPYRIRMKWNEIKNKNKNL